MDASAFQKLLSDVQKNKQAIERKVKDLESTEFIASSGGGLCEIVMNGKYEVLRCTLDDKVVGDKETIQDLVVTAVTEAVSRINAEMKKLQEDFLPPINKLF